MLPFKGLLISTLPCVHRASKRPVKKKLPNLVWSMMKDKELRASCKKHGLISSGKKPELMKRLKEYTLRYNAQIDQLKQKSGETNYIPLNTAL